MRFAIQSMRARSRALVVVCVFRHAGAVVLAAAVTVVHVVHGLHAAFSCVMVRDVVCNTSHASRRCVAKVVGARGYSPVVASVRRRRRSVVSSVGRSGRCGTRSSVPPVAASGLVSVVAHAVERGVRMATRILLVMADVFVLIALGSVALIGLLVGVLIMVW